MRTTPGAWDRMSGNVRPWSTVALEQPAQHQLFYVKVVDFFFPLFTEPGCLFSTKVKIDRHIFLAHSKHFYTAATS